MAIYSPLHLRVCISYKQRDSSNDSWPKCSALYSAVFVGSCQNEWQQGVATTGRNTTGPLWSVGRPTTRALSGRPVRQLAGSYRRRQTTTDASEQNNTGPLGGPVINSRGMLTDYNTVKYHVSLRWFLYSPTAYRLTGRFLQLENIGSRIDMQTHAGNGRMQHSGVLVCGIRDMITRQTLTLSVENVLPSCRIVIDIMLLRISDKWLTETKSQYNSINYVIK